MAKVGNTATVSMKISIILLSCIFKSSVIPTNGSVCMCRNNFKQDDLINESVPCQMNACIF